MLTPKYYRLSYNIQYNPLPHTPTPIPTCNINIYFGSSYIYIYNVWILILIYAWVSPYALRIFTILFNDNNNKIADIIQHELQITTSILFLFYMKFRVIKAIDILGRGIKLAEISQDFFKCSEVYIHYGRKTYPRYKLHMNIMITNKLEIIWKDSCFLSLCIHNMNT